MAAVKALDQRVTFSMFVQGLGKQFQSILAGTLSPDQKLALIIEAMERDTQAKRVTARQIGAQMRSLKDPETKELEPLEAKEARRAKLVTLGGQNLDNPAMLGQIQQEIKGLDSLISSETATYNTLKESYDLALANYKTAYAALESTRNNGPAILSAIKAHQQAIAARDQAKKTTTAPDTKFMTDLLGELEKTKAEMRTDKEMDADLDATRPGSIDAKLAEMDAKEVDTGLMAEFQAAAAKQAK